VNLEKLPNPWGPNGGKIPMWGKNLQIIFLAQSQEEGKGEKERRKVIRDTEHSMKKDHALQRRRGDQGRDRFVPGGEHKGLF